MESRAKCAEVWQCQAHPRLCSQLKISNLANTQHLRVLRTIIVVSSHRSLFLDTGPANSRSSLAAADEDPPLEPLKLRTVKPIAVSRPAAKASGLGQLLASRRGSASNAAQSPQV